MKAVIKSAPSATMSKSNGSTYCLVSALVMDGPAKGLLVTATRTLSNKDGVAKKSVAINDEVTLYHSMLPSTTGAGNAHFFEVSIGMETVANSVLDKLFA